MSKPIVINMFGGPSTGKSTVASGIFYYLKRLGYNVELINEYAKELVWENHSFMLDDQIMIFAHQQRKLKRLNGKVDIIITDSPLLLGRVYSSSDTPTSLHNLIDEVWNQYNNINFLLTRTTNYVELGRVQTEEEAINIDKIIEDLLTSRNETLHRITPNEFFDVAMYIVDEYIRKIYKN